MLRPLVISLIKGLGPIGSIMPYENEEILKERSLRGW